VPRGSAADANTTQTRKNVRIASITSPSPGPTPVPSEGAPRLIVWPVVPGSAHLSRSVARIAAPKLCDPVDERERRMDAARREEPER
jgi:hypothetical protein